MARRCWLTVATAVAVANAACSPEVVIARSKPVAEGAAGSAGAAAGGPNEPANAGASNGGEGGGGNDAPRLLADSVADFSLTQGLLGWSYGYDTGSPETFSLMSRKAVIVDYVPATKDVWNCWATDDTHWAQIFQLGAHPNGTNTSPPSVAILQRAVRRWVSSFAGPVLIRGEVAKIDIVDSNGIDALVYVDGDKLYSTFIAGDDGGGRSYEVHATLRVGSTVDFVLDPHDGDDHHDLSRFTGIIAQEDPPTTP